MENNRFFVVSVNDERFLSPLQGKLPLGLKRVGIVLSGGNVDYEQLGRF